MTSSPPKHRTLKYRIGKPFAFASGECLDTTQAAPSTKSRERSRSPHHMESATQEETRSLDSSSTSATSSRMLRVSPTRKTRLTMLSAKRMDSILQTQVSGNQSPSDEEDNLEITTPKARKNLHLQLQTPQAPRKGARTKTDLVREILDKYNVYLFSQFQYHTYSKLCGALMCFSLICITTFVLIN